MTQRRTKVTLYHVSSHRTMIATVLEIEDPLFPVVLHPGDSWKRYHRERGAGDHSELAVDPRNRYVLLQNHTQDSGTNIACYLLGIAEHHAQSHCRARRRKSIAAAPGSDLRY